jgi:hypothetical protein
VIVESFKKWELEVLLKFGLFYEIFTLDLIAIIR